MSILLTVLSFLASHPAQADAAPRPPAFRQVTVDSKVGIGYGVAVADIDGDRKPDIVLADKDKIAWYRNPGWEKSVMAEKLTALDHVCIAARDVDGDGRAEVAVGAGWNPGDTTGSGSVHYLIAPGDRKGRWEPIKLHHEPTVHRMKWLRGPGSGWSLVVSPLHGRQNKGGEGEGIRLLAYEPPGNARDPWSTQLMDGALHVTHNLEAFQWDKDPEEEVLLAAKEGVFLLDREGPSWKKTQIGGNGPGDTGFQGASEVRTGLLPGGKRFVATVEPFHGNKVVVYTPPPAGAPGLWSRREIDDSLAEGHAVAAGDLAGSGCHQLVVGWRKKDRSGKVGIRLYTPLDPEGKSWARATIDDDAMACEDLVIADLDGNGKLDIVAAGRDTHNLKVYLQ